MHFLRFTFLWMVLHVFITSSAIGQTPDIIYFNGTILKGDKGFGRVRAIAIKDGKILATGNDNEILLLKGNNTNIINLKNKTVVPGFNDAHLHPSPIYPFESLHTVLDIQPDSVKNIEELISLLKRKASITPAGYPIRGRGYQDTKLGGHPTAAMLDQASTLHPIMLTHSSGHISVVNSYLLKLAGITKNTPDPPGGAFDRNKDGSPNGVCKESAFGYLLSHLPASYSFPPPSFEEEAEGYRKCFERFIANGITSITEAGADPRKIPIYEWLQKNGLALRINLLISEKYLDAVINGKLKSKYQNDSLRISGIKVFHGNSLSGRTCWLNEPYDMVNPATGKYDYYGIPPARNQEALNKLFQKIQSNNLQIAVHSNGDREIEMVILAMEYAGQNANRSNTRNRIEHCSITTDKIMQKLLADSIIPVFHSYIYEHGDKLVFYGKDRFNHIHPDRTAIDMGIQGAQHSDYPISDARPLLRIESMVTRTSKEGLVIGDQQKVSPMEAIRLWTYGGAYASFEEKEKGSLEPGKWADLVILDNDPTKTDAFSIKKITVLETMIRGKVVFTFRQ